MEMGRALALVVLGFAGCVQILGDDFATDPGEGAAAAGGSGASGATGPGGGGAGGVGTGGGGGAPCEVGVLGSCGAGRKCSVVDFVSGQPECVLAGPRPAHSRCDADTNCAEGTFCDPPSSVCLDVCATGADCANGGQCVPPTDALGNAILGIRVCLSNCNLVTGAPCDQSYGPVTCIPPGGGATTSCWQSAGAGAGEGCLLVQDCAAGTVCTNDSLCHAWCTPPGVQATCAVGSLCTDVSVVVEGVDYGVCP
ncbi:MAG: hypothetical protein HY908_19655 [Myxococcales bacterium]|nr:hypothetical protein [Myxococcales bacterium]